MDNNTNENIYMTSHEYQENKTYDDNSERIKELEQIRKDQEQGLLNSSIEHADEVINSESNLKGLQMISSQNSFLITIPKILLSKIRESKKKDLHDTMVGMVLDYDKIEDKGMSRKLEKKGSIFTSILILSITMTIGIIVAIVLTLT